MKQYVTYLRVSTQKQGAQGLGISAQREMCDKFIKQNGGEHVKEFMDVESGTHRDRKGLWDAIEYCKKNDYSLVIAKLDRLARDVEFTFKVINTGIDIHFTDMPIVNCMILGVFAAVAQYEREMCSKRTKQALAEKKKQGACLGASNEKYIASRAKKTREEIEVELAKRGQTRRMRFQESNDVVAFKRICQRVFGDACKGEPKEWDWTQVNTKGENKRRILGMMCDYQAMDKSADGVFARWDFADIESKALQSRLAAYIATLRNSVMK